MPRNGSGVFTMPGATFPVVFNTVATDTAFNANLNDVASALTNSIAVDGQSVITANIPMNSKKITGLAAGTAAGDSIEYAQFNDVATRTKSDIINGQFRIAQAGTSFAGPADAAYDLDGWSNGNTSAAVFTVDQAAGSSTGKLCRTVTVTTADAAVAAGDQIGQFVKIEGYNCVKYLGQTFTLGFWVKSSVTGIHCIAIYNGTSTYVDEYTINAANTWEYKTITVINGTPVIANSTNLVGLYVIFTNMAGATYQTTKGSWQAGNYRGTSSQVNDVATIGNVFGLQDVTMNLGTTVTINDTSFEKDLALCQRYYFAANVIVEVAGLYQSWSFPVPMRANPTVTGGGAGFAIATASSLIANFYQNTRAAQGLSLSARL